MNVLQKLTITEFEPGPMASEATALSTVIQIQYPNLLGFWPETLPHLELKWFIRLVSGMPP